MKKKILNKKRSTIAYHNGIPYDVTYEKPRFIEYFDGIPFEKAISEAVRICIEHVGPMGRMLYPPDCSDGVLMNAEIVHSQLGILWYGDIESSRARSILEKLVTEINYLYDVKSRVNIPGSVTITTLSGITLTSV